MRTPSLPALLAALTLLFASAASRALEPAKAGEIAAELEAKEKAIQEKHGDLRQLSPEQRKAYGKELQEARVSTLQKHNTTSKEFETARLKMGRGDRAQSEEARKAWPEQQKKLAEEAKKAEAAKATKKNSGIQVQRGFDDDNPVVLDGEQPKENGVVVQRGAGSEGIEIPVGGDDAAAAASQ
ncbi:MAG: hypothetical protein HY901_09020 [Deltaproteobacteria bacterium]|nr:hypothetical protein [Deltaproteobacteria bacterium]